MAHSQSSSKKDNEPPESSSISPLRSGMKPFTSQNPFTVLPDMSEGESYDKGGPKPLRSFPHNDGGPKPLRSFPHNDGGPNPPHSPPNNNERPKPINSSSNKSGRPKTLQSSPNDNGEPKPSHSPPNDRGRPKPSSNSSSNKSGRPKTLQSSPNDNGEPKPSHSPPNDRGRPKPSSNSFSNKSGRPKTLQSSPNDNGEPKPSHSPPNDRGRPKPSSNSSSNKSGRPKSLQSSPSNTGRPKPLPSSQKDNGGPEPLKSSPSDNGGPKSTSVKSPKRSPNKGFRNQHEAASDSSSWTRPTSGQTRQGPKKNEMRNNGKTNHRLPISGSVKEAFMRLKSEAGGYFTQLCEKCHDSSPPITSVKSPIGPYCSSPLEQHPWEPNKVLGHILDMKEGKVRYLKIRQLPRNILKKSLKLCPNMDKQSGCIQGNSCRWAHNKVELKVWQYQVEHNVNSFKIAQLCCTTNGHLDISTVPKLLQTLQYVNFDGSQNTSNQMVSYYESKKSWCYVRPRPSWLHPTTTPTLCKNGDECWQADSCTYPHHLEEIELWIYMAKNQYRTLDEVLSASKSLYSSSSTSSPHPLISNEVLQILPYYCQYCHEQFSHRGNLRQHLQTMEHRSNVDSDKEKADDWKHRELPFTVLNGGFIKQCKALVEGGTCLLGESSCTDAHSREELAEWKERCEYLMMKRRMAKEQELYPLTEGDLLERQSAGQNVMTTSLPTGVTMECSDENLTKVLEAIEKSKETFKFNITATEKNPLRKVYLLRDDHRKYFHLLNPMESGAKLQECPGVFLKVQDDDVAASPRYCVSVAFESSSMGSFKQLMGFDFGSMPMVVREITVEVGSQALQTPTTQDEISMKPNCTVVKFTDESMTNKPTLIEEELLEKYKVPVPLSSDHGRLEPLSRDNYKQVMHNALYREEVECNKKITRFATSGTLKVSCQAVLPGVRTEYAQGGYLFASVSLKESLIDDTVASQIFIRSVQSVLLEFTDSDKSAHYEAPILPNQTLGDKEEEVLLIKLSKECIADLQLEDGVERNVKLKFQLNREPFCVMHFGIDEMKNMGLVFPEGEGPQMLPACPSSCVGTDEKINAHQQEVIDLISKHGGNEAPLMSGVGPVLMYGPFGTGKTSTMAMAVKKILKPRPSCKILICTHSNSAADLYLRDNGTFRTIRMYTTMRNTNSIHPTVLKYVPKDANGNIRLPDKTEIQAAQVVVTTLTTATYLVSAGLHGNFSHIFIDEAGQVLEAEVLIPLALAAKDTCVVLTGDHMQMSPKVYSKAVRDAGLDSSLLQRLLLTKKCKQKFLTSNYRTCQSILDFTSKTFYKQNLKAGIRHLEHPHVKPMTFCVVKGVEYHSGMSYANNYETHEVGRQVKLLMEGWLTAEWGDFQENVAVLAAYTTQVRLIRAYLRKEGFHNVTVDTVDNVQGKQFRAVIISTVRTRVINSRQDADSELDYRLLSDPKLVNTAFTRAQSVLCVVGDPVALCSVGRCSTIWQEFLKCCEQNESLHPLGTTVKAIEGEIQSANRKLNPKATPFKPSKKTTNSSPSHQNREQLLPFDLDDEQEFPTLGGPLKEAQETQDDDEGATREDDSEDYQDDEEYILHEMERQVEEDNRREMMEKTTEESIAKVTQIKPSDGDVGHHGQGDGPESIAKVTIQKERANEDVGQLQGDMDVGRQGPDGLESIAKVTIQKKPSDGDVGDHGQGDGPESIAKVAIQKKGENEDVGQLQGDMDVGRQGPDRLESIAKVTIQMKPLDGEVVQQQDDMNAGHQGPDGLESIAKVAIQKKRENEDVGQLQGDMHVGRQGPDSLESITNVTIQKKPLEGDVIQKQDDRDAGHQGPDGLESIAKVAIQKKGENEDDGQLQGDMDVGHQGPDGLESIAKVNIQEKPFKTVAVQHQEGENMGGRQPGGGSEAESIAKVNIQNRNAVEELAQRQGGGADGQQPAAGGNDEQESIAKVDVQERAVERKPNREELPEIKMMPNSSKKQKIRMQNKNNSIRLLNFHYDRSNLQGAGCDVEDEEEDQENGLEMLSEEKRWEGLSLVSSNPDTFKRCLFHFETSGYVFAIPKGECSSEKIWICGKKKKGQALHMDEVVVEILEWDMENENLAESNEKKIYGRVFCILKRSTNPVGRKIVCTLDRHSNNLFVPIDRTFPKIVAFSRADKNSRWKQSRKTGDVVQVTVFKGTGPSREFDRFVYVQRKDKLNKHFVVRYSHWYSGHPFPMGYVVQELPTADNKEKGIHTLKLTHGIREDFKHEILEEIERKFPGDWTIPHSEIQKRKDLRSKCIFTVDNPETQDLDDALSIDVDKDGQSRVGIHIADVSYFVEKNSAVDQEASERGVSFYPALSEPVNMLPSRLVDLCSLQPGKDRLAMSIFVIIQKDGSTPVVDAIEESVIRSQKRLTYEDAEKLIATQQGGSDEAEKVLIQLGQLAQLVRRKRLGEDGCHVFSHGSEEEELQHPRASSMVEEMMLIANEAVAGRLMHEHSKLTPLRSQLPPSPEKLDGWQSKHQHDIPNSLFLTSKAYPKRKSHTGASNDDVFIMKDKWQQLVSMADSPAPNHFMQMADIVCCDQNHPQLAVAEREFFHLQEPATYICSGDHRESKKRRHHSLGKTYTNFTSPIRRYIDIVVHRMLKCVIQKAAQASGMTGVSAESPYTMEEMSAICHHSTVQSVRAKRFHKETKALMFALKLQETPETLLAYIASIEGANLELLFPYHSFISKTAYTLPLSHLKPHTKQDKTDNEGDQISLAWKSRIYDINEIPEKVTSLVKPPMKKLDSEQFVVKIKAATWQRMQEKIKERDLPGFQQIVKKEQDRLRRRESDKRSKSQIDKKSTLPVTEVTSEIVDSKGNHATFVEMWRDFKQGDVLQITLSAALFKGVISPRPQCINLTPKLTFCTEHRAEPLESFNVVASNSLVKFEDIKKYKATWLPIIEMFSVHGAVHADETVFIRNNQIKWSKVNKEGTEPRIEGVFDIPSSCLKERKIKLSFHHFKSDEEEESDDEEVANDEPERCLDYLCIQYNFGNSLTELLDSEAENENHPNSDSPRRTKAVLHAAVIDVTKYKSDLTVRFVVKGSSSPFPEVLLSSSKQFPCTVEVIPKGENDRRLEDAVRLVDNASPMIEQIALGLQPSELCEMTSKIPSLHRIIGRVTEAPFKLNEVQETAVTMAAKQSFTTIQGPPGTGKTIVGARITKVFTDLNKELHKSGKCNKPQQVLYCGPSNESVNVVANYLLNCKVKAVRVYSSMIEDQHHPIPHSPIRKDPTVRDNVVPAELQHISLHSLIRQPSNTHSEKIIELDELFKTQDYHASREEVKTYRKLIATAKEEEIQKYDVILATCSHSGSPVIAGKANIAQCVIDEAGMCSQPETLIPLVFNKPRQIVLIGDHKQLRPIITETTAQQLGMETSLLELYEEKAIMLTTQYRMHESICAFPSQTFYKSKLETADSVKQRQPEHQKLLKKLPGGENFRAAFCHVIGHEKILACKAAEGNEMSRANPEEVKHAVRIANNLLNQGVKPENIIILSQYRLQCAEIRDALALGRRDLKKIKVTTVITSQGREWDFVILSLVRSLPKVEIEEKPSLGWMHHNLGFIMDDNQVNVALTRAKKGLIIIGNQFLLQVHDKWRELISMYRDKSAVVNARSFLRS